MITLQVAAKEHVLYTRYNPGRNISMKQGLVRDVKGFQNLWNLFRSIAGEAGDYAINLQGVVAESSA